MKKHFSLFLWNYRVRFLVSENYIVIFSIYIAVYIVEIIYASMPIFDVEKQRLI